MRAAFATLWNLDLAFADVVATTSEPALGAIRLAWWRERLQELDAKAAAAAEPRLSAVQRLLVHRGISGAELSTLEDAWLPLLNPFPWSEDAAEALRQRGRILFGIGARLLGGEAADAQACGAVWSLVDGVNHCSDGPSRRFLCAAARRSASELSPTVPRAVRPLTILAALAVYDLRGGGRLGRVGVAVAHRLRGALPHS